VWRSHERGWWECRLRLAEKRESRPLLGRAAFSGCVCGAVGCEP